MSIVPHRLCKPRLLVFSKSLLGLTALVLGFSLCLISRHALAQDKVEQKTEKEGEEVKIQPPEDIDLTTEDDLQMKATCFPGVKGQESIPVILLHGFDSRDGKNEIKHSRQDFTQDEGLAKLLQEKLGCFVIVPDLRGHGESNKIKVRKQLEDVVPKGRRLQPAQISKIVTQDLRAVKDYLWKKNNEKALNIDKLAVIGVDEGASLALSYAYDDFNGYEQGQATYGPLKLGKFVKVAVLISPVANVIGLNTAKVMRDPEFCQKLQVMIVVGNKSPKYFSDAEKLSNLFKRAHPGREPREAQGENRIVPFEFRYALAGLQAAWRAVVERAAQDR